MPEVLQEEVIVGAETSLGESSYVLETPEELGAGIKLPADVTGEPQSEMVAEEEALPTYDLSMAETGDLPLEVVGTDVQTAEFGARGIEDVAAPVGI